MFIDEITMEVHAGHGGKGCVSFRREKYVPRGGPDGGDGGKGGAVIFRANSHLRTLGDYRYKRHYDAEGGHEGSGNKSSGKNGQDLVLQVPTGTMIFDSESHTLLVDLTADGQEFLAAKGGRGGRGNQHFATSTHRAPKYAQPGEEGEHRKLRLELKLLADIGLVGFPNAGKSTFINQVSRSKSPIGDYPFTTLQPHLGVVRLNDEVEFVVADIPGIIEGAHEGHGMGLQFLRHIERTRVILHLIDCSPFSGRNAVEDYQVLRRELSLYSADLARKPELVLANKIDIVGVEQAVFELQSFCEEYEIPFYTIAAATGEGVEPVLWRAWELLQESIAAEPVISPVSSYQPTADDDSVLDGEDGPENIWVTEDYYDDDDDGEPYDEDGDEDPDDEADPA